MKLVGTAGRAIQLCQKPSCPGKDLASLSPMLKDLLPHCNVPMACHAAPPTRPPAIPRNPLCMPGWVRLFDVDQFDSQKAQ